MIICKYYDLKYEEINEFWKKRENSYLITLLMKNFKCLNNNELRKRLGISNNKSLYNKVKIAEEKILINKRFREEYFELEEKIKENLKNASDRLGTECGARPHRPGRQLRGTSKAGCIGGCHSGQEEPWHHP